MPVEPGEAWGTHADHLERHPPQPGTTLAREGCAGTLHVESVMSANRVVVTCDACWAVFSIGPKGRGGASRPLEPQEAIF